MSQPSLLDVARQGNPRAISLLLNAVLMPKQVRAIVTRSDAHLAVTLQSEKNISQPAAVMLIRTALEKLLLPDIEAVHIEARCLGIPLWEEEFLLVSQADHWNLTLGEMFEPEPSPGDEPINGKEKVQDQVDDQDKAEVIATHDTLAEIVSPEPSPAIGESSHGEPPIPDDQPDDLETFLEPLDPPEDVLSDPGFEHLEEIIAVEPPLISEHSDDLAPLENAELAEPANIADSFPEQDFASLEEIITAEPEVETISAADGEEDELEAAESWPPADFQNDVEKDEPEPSPPALEEPDEPVLSQTMPQLPDPWLDTSSAIAPEPDTTLDIVDQNIIDQNIVAETHRSGVDASVMPSEPAAMANESTVEHSPLSTPPPAPDLMATDSTTTEPIPAEPGLVQDKIPSVTPSEDATDTPAAPPDSDSPDPDAPPDSPPDAPFEGAKFTVPTVEKVSRDGESKVAGVAGMVMGLGFCATGLGSVIGLPMVVGGMWMLGDEEVLRGDCPHCGQSLKVPLGKLWRFSCPSCQGLIQIKNGKFYAKTDF